MSEFSIDVEPLLTSSDPIDEAAKEYFGLDYLYPLQRFVIANILENQDQIVVMPTGSGKTVCFTLPIYFLKGITLVIFPLLSLLEDQKRRLLKNNVEVGIYRGGQSSEERQNLRLRIKEGQIRIVLATPEALINSSLDFWFDEGDSLVSHFVIDEAHCVFEWGQSFRPAYLEIGKWLQKLSPGLISAFTATASDEIEQNIKDCLFFDRCPKSLKVNPDRPNILYSVYTGLSKLRKFNQILNKLRRPVVVFCRSRRRTEHLARYLREKLKSDQVFFYHAGLYREERKRVENWYFDSEDGILIATSAYGMGVDKNNIRNVIHYDVPLSVEAYLQESGRAGRDQGVSHSVLLCSPEDVSFLGKSALDFQTKRYQKILSYVFSLDICRRELLLSFMDHKFEYCSGCDICSDELKLKNWGQSLPLNLLLKFFKIHSRRYSIREACMVLKGEKNYATLNHKYWKDRYFGILNDWDHDEINNLIDNLLITSTLKISNSFFLKGRLCFKLKNNKFAEFYHFFH